MTTLQAVELGVLGPLQVRQDGAPVAIPGAKPRAVLTMLGLHHGSIVSADTLAELLWAEDPPRTAGKALQTHISSLRRALGDGFVITHGTGWALAESEVDASRYRSAARLGRDAAATGDISQAVACFEEALALWRGIPELPDSRRGTSEKTRWIEGHAALVEDRADALLATRARRGDHRRAGGGGGRGAAARTAMGPAHARPLPRRAAGRRSRRVSTGAGNCWPKSWGLIPGQSFDGSRPPSSHRMLHWMWLQHNIIRR